MSNELVVVNKLEVPVFQNEYLAESVRKIIECSRNIVVNNFQIAYELASIKKLELYKEAGYESVADFAEKVFGFSKTSTSMAIKVAERYLINEGDRIATTFLDNTGTDFSFNQLIETLPLSERRVNSLVFDKKLRPTMTLKQIRAVVQEEKNKGINLGDSSLEHELKDVIARISSVQSGQELKEEKSDNLSEDRESISSSQEEEHELKQEIPSDTAQIALESKENSSRVSEYQNSSETLSEGFRIAENSLSDDLEEHELKEYVELLKKEIKRLKEENYKLAHPIKRGRGRPRKNQD